MNNHIQRQFVVSAVALLSLIAGWNTSEGEEASVAGGNGQPVEKLIFKKE